MSFPPVGLSHHFPAALSHDESAIENQSELPRWKRTLDLALIILAAPLWLPTTLAVMLWIWCVSPGPIFFRQERIGLRGRRFMLYKFRSMKVNADSGAHISHVTELIRSNLPMSKLDGLGDERLIPLGRIMRALGLDELPQIFNVLRGEMTLVGPRPCTTYEFEQYHTDHSERVRVTPGLTGYWQVNGKNRTTFSEMVEMDVFYARNRSLKLDLRILLRTIPAVLGQLF